MIQIKNDWSKIKCLKLCISQSFITWVQLVSAEVDNIEKPENREDSVKSLSKLDDYIEKRKLDDPEFADNFEQGYAEFKVGAMLKQTRIQAGLTQEEVARRLKTTKSSISRIENHAKDIKLSTLERFAEAVGKHLTIAVD